MDVLYSSNKQEKHDQRLVGKITNDLVTWYNKMQKSVLHLTTITLEKVVLEKSDWDITSNSFDIIVFVKIFGNEHKYTTTIILNEPFKRKEFEKKLTEGLIEKIKQEDFFLRKRKETTELLLNELPRL